MTSILQIRNVHHAYEGKTVLRAEFAPQVFETDLASGESALLIGPSGSGKSTLLSLISGLSLSTGGDIFVAGKSWRSMAETTRDAHRAAHIGYLPQRQHLLAALSVRENVLLPFYFLRGEITGEAKMRADALLEDLGIAARAGAKIFQISQGEAQRVCLARALINAPKLLLADEPTANLDDASAGSVATLIAQTSQRQQSALVIATHDARLRAQIPAAQIWALKPC